MATVTPFAVMPCTIDCHVMHIAFTNLRCLHAPIFSATDLHKQCVIVSQLERKSIDICKFAVSATCAVLIVPIFKEPIRAKLLKCG